MKLALALALGLSFANLAFADGPGITRNLSFEADGREGVEPIGWFQVGGGYSAQTIRGGVDGRYALAIFVNPGIASTSAAPRLFGGVGQCVPAAYFYGRTVLLTGTISTWNLVDGYAGLWLRVDGPNGQVISLDNMSDRPVFGSTAWNLYGSTADIPYTATQICFGVINTGLGYAYADNLSLTDFSF